MPFAVSGCSPAEPRQVRSFAEPSTSLAPFASVGPQVKIDKSPAVLLKGMEGSVMGVWCAHGEGRALFPDESIRQDVLAKGLTPIT